MFRKFTRRDALKASGLALGGLAVGHVLGGACGDSSTEQAPYDPANANSLIAGLDPYYPGTETLAANEMRIRFLGTSGIPRLAQDCNSVFVERAAETSSSSTAGPAWSSSTTPWASTTAG